MKIKDLTPKLSIPSLENELNFPENFQDNTNQMLGGLTAGSRELKQGKIRIQGTDERILFGDVESYSAGIGVYIGKDIADGLYKFRAGDPAGVMLSWNGTALNVVGFLPTGSAANDVNTNVTTIEGGKITALSVTATQIAAAAITGAKIAAGTITASNITASTITGSLIAAGTITGSNMLANTITSTQLATTNLITLTAQIADAVISSAKIISLTADKLTAGTIDASSITVTNLSATNLTVGTISMSRVADGSITAGAAGKLAASTITDFNIGSLNASKITAGTISASTVTITNINASNISTGTLSADRISSGAITSAKIQTNLSLTGLTLGAKAQFSDQLTVGYTPGSSSSFSLRLGGSYGDRIWFNEGTDKLEMHDDLTVAGDTYIGSGSMTFENGNILTMSSSKTAILPTSQGYRALYCAESPEVWFFDFVPFKDKIDPVFEEVTIGEKHFIKTEDGSYLVFARRIGHENKRFEYKTEEEFLKNEKFLRMAKVN